MDIVICVGPNDAHVVSRCIESVRQYIQYRTIVCIAAPGIEPIQNVVWIPESVFPFTKKDMNAGERSGWYLQQLLKIYAPLVLPQLSDTYLILDADVVFHKHVSFSNQGIIQFNVGTEYHRPYFYHMKRLHPALNKVRDVSGICHLMPMKRHIVKELIRQVEVHHSSTFWKVFIDAVDPRERPYSGASEYEILFSFTLSQFPNEAVVHPLEWANSQSVTPGYTGVYEAVHYYMRRA